MSRCDARLPVWVDQGERVCAGRQGVVDAVLDRGRCGHEDASGESVVNPGPGGGHMYICDRESETCWPQRDYPAPYGYS